MLQISSIHSLYAYGECMIFLRSIFLVNSHPAKQDGPQLFKPIFKIWTFFNVFLFSWICTLLCRYFGYLAIWLGLSALFGTVLSVNLCDYLIYGCSWEKVVHKICENQIFQNKVLVQHFATDHENSTLGQVLHKMPYLVQQIAWLGSYQYLIFHKQAIYIIE